MPVYACAYKDPLGHAVWGSPFEPTADGELRTPLHAEWEETPVGLVVRAWGYPENDDVEPLRGLFQWTNTRQMSHKQFMVGIYELRRLSDDPWDDINKFIPPPMQRRTQQDPPQPTAALP